MFTVKKKAKTPNIIWDAENNRPLCKFNRNGIIETNDGSLAEKLKALGHTVTGKADEKVEVPTEPETESSESGTKEQDAEKETENKPQRTSKGK